MAGPADIEKLLAAKRQRRGVQIDLGCGDQTPPDFVGIDIRPGELVDIVWDLEEYPWPLPDQCAELLISSHLVEHINPAKGGFLRFMDEAWRILLPDGIFMIACPYAGSAGYWQDPTHVNGITERTWAYFDPLEPNTNGQLYSIYRPKPWKILKNVWEAGGNLEIALQKRGEDYSHDGQAEDVPAALKERVKPIQ